MRFRLRGRDGKGVVFTTTQSHDIGLSVLWSSFCILDKMIICIGSFEQAANSVDKNSITSKGTLDNWKLSSRCGFLQARSSYRNESVRIP